jgi:hypothetical protein
MLIAADGLLQNQGIAISSNLTIAINSYHSCNVIASYDKVLGNAVANLGVGNSSVTSNVMHGLQTLAANTVPAVTNVVPTAYISSLGPYANTYIGGLSGLVLQQAAAELGNGDLSKFFQSYGIVQSYIYQTNQYINSVANVGAIGNTFTSMNSVITGSISTTNSNLNAFGSDLLLLGKTWDLANLAYFGFPSALLYQTTQVAGLLPELAAKLSLAGITYDDLSTILGGNLPAAANIEALIYQVMLSVTGSLLEQVKTILAVTTPGLTSMADLLNPVKTLPNSYLTLTLPTPTNSSTTNVNSTALSPIYTGPATVNSNLLDLFSSDPTYILLATVIPPDQALANQAIARSLQQIKNIFSLTLPVFANATLAVQTNTGLPLINGLTQPVPTNVVNSLNSTLATGTGPNGTLTLYDFFGALVGIPYTDDFNQTTTVINSMQAANAFYYLTNSSTGAYPTMLDCISGTYTVVSDPGPPEQVTVTIPAGLPGAGVYTSVEEAFITGLIPATGNLIANIANSYTANTTSLNNYFNDIASHLVTEKNNLALAQVNFGELTANSRSATMSFAGSLHQIGQDNSPQGAAQFFTAIADTSNIYGQAIVSSLREGNNIVAMGAAGITSDTQIPTR